CGATIDDAVPYQPGLVVPGVVRGEDGPLESCDGCHGRSPFSTGIVRLRAADGKSEIWTDANCLVPQHPQARVASGFTSAKRLSLFQVGKALARGRGPETVM